MKKAVIQLDSTVDPEQYLQLSSTFESISKTEKNEWLPDYYASYCYILAVFYDLDYCRDTNKIDKYIDKAEFFINEANTISPNNSEITTLNGLVNWSRIVVDPLSRGEKYTTIAMQYWKEAEKQDSLNPRPFLLEGQNILGLTKIFGGGKKKAKPVIASAVAKYNAFVPKSDISPKWGQKWAEDLLKECENKNVDNAQVVNLK